MIRKLASKYCKNKILIYTVRPLWRVIMRIKKKYSQLIFRKRAYRVLSRFSDCCNQNNITFWLEFGTLLGSYRDNGFIPHDFDLDLAIYYKDADLLQNVLLNNGFKLTRKFESCGNRELGLEFTYEFDSIPIDVFIFHIKENNLICHSFTPILNERDYEGLSEVKEISFPNNGIKKYDFNGIQVGIPNDTREHLVLNYGENFMIPDKNFDYKKVATNIKYYSRQERLATLTTY